MSRSLTADMAKGVKGKWQAPILGGKSEWQDCVLEDVSPLYSLVIHDLSAEGRKTISWIIHWRTHLVTTYPMRHSQGLDDFMIKQFCPVLQFAIDASIGRQIRSAIAWKRICRIDDPDHDLGIEIPA